MHGVPADLDLSFFVGKQLSHVTLGEFAVFFTFHPEGHVRVEGGWEAVDPGGAVFDRACDDADRDVYRVHRLLGRDVTGYRVQPPGSFELELEGGYRLRIIDDNEHYESFTIEPLGLVV